MVRSLLSNGSSEFPHTYTMTIQAEISIKRVVIEDNKVELLVFDIGGHEIFREYIPKIVSSL